MKKISLLCALGICVILAAGCSSKTKENETESFQEITDTSTQEYNYTLSDVEEFESDGVKYEQGKAEKLQFIYPVMEDVTAANTLVGTYNTSVYGNWPNIDETDTSYMISSFVTWPDLYDNQKVESIEYTVYNSTCYFVDDSADLRTCSNKKKFSSQSMKLTAADNKKFKMFMVVELPTSKDAWNGYKQQGKVENKAKKDVLENALIKAQVLYTDGTEQTDYYKIKIQGSMTSIDIYKVN